MNMTLRIAVICTTIACAIACGHDHEEGEFKADAANFRCAAATDGHTGCVDNTIVVCHADKRKHAEGPHFDSVRDCAAGFSCVPKLVGGVNRAFCVGTVACTAADVSCDGLTPKNCIDGKATDAQRCGTAEQCAVTDGYALCAPR